MWQNKSNINYKLFKPAGPAAQNISARPMQPQQPQQQQPQARPNVKQRKVSCPHCGFEQFAIEEALSVFCKNCSKRITVGAMIKPQQSQMAQVDAFKRMTQHPTHFRSTTCPKCAARQNVPNNALSSFCQKCGHRINLQDYEIKGKFTGPLSTKGTLLITISGDVRSDVNVGNAVIEGKLVGKVIAEGVVELKSTAKLYGDVIAAKLIVSDGALFAGHAMVPPNIHQPA